MSKKLYIPILISLVILLTACNLVIEEEKQTTKTKEKPIEIVSLMIEEYDEITSTYSEPQYLINSEFIGSTKHHTNYKDNSVETTIEAEYYADLHRPYITYIISELYYYEDGEVKKGQTTSGKTNGVEMSLKIESANINTKTSHTIKFIDIDYVKEVTIVQFNAEHEKIKSDIVDFKVTKKKDFIIEANTKDFIIIEHYLTYDHNDYEIKTLVSASKINDSLNNTYIKGVLGLDDEGNRYIAGLYFKQRGRN